MPDGVVGICGETPIGGGLVLLAIPGMARDCHDGLPARLLASWMPEQLDYLHDMGWWRAIFEQATGVEVTDMREMACTREAWADWVECDNDYARRPGSSKGGGARVPKHYQGGAAQELTASHDAACSGGGVRDGGAEPHHGGHRRR